MYGATLTLASASSSRRGLSPRVRGNREPRLDVADVNRSIPACTGQPCRLSACSRRRKVYPRVYGATSAPPRSAPYPIRSIPACTGQPGHSLRPPPHRAVYPRVYGATLARAFFSVCEMGLSPRVRGNPASRQTWRCAPRSIPACTGQPPRPRTGGALPAVYPRVYGATSPTSASEKRRTGLSPRVRGNPPAATGTTISMRSIPACTGQPLQGLWGQGD